MSARCTRPPEPETSKRRGAAQQKRTLKPHEKDTKTKRKRSCAIGATRGTPSSPESSGETGGTATRRPDDPWPGRLPATRCRSLRESATRTACGRRLSQRQAPAAPVRRQRVRRRAREQGGLRLAQRQLRPRPGAIAHQAGHRAAAEPAQYPDSLQPVARQTRPSRSTTGPRPPGCRTRVQSGPEGHREPGRALPLLVPIDATRPASSDSNPATPGAFTGAARASSSASPRSAGANGESRRRTC